MPRTVRENLYNLTVVHHFMKHGMAYLLQDQEADSIISVCLNEFVARFRVTYVVHIDQSANVESTLINKNKLLKVLRIAMTQTIPYFPQCDD